MSVHTGELRDGAHGAGLAPLAGDVHLEHNLLQKKLTGWIGIGEVDETQDYKRNAKSITGRKQKIVLIWTYCKLQWIDRTESLTLDMVRKNPTKEKGRGLSSLVELRNFVR